MMDANSASFLGDVKVFTSDNRGFTPEELASRALDRIIYVGDQSHPVITEQARAYKEAIYQELVRLARQAQDEARTTLCAKLTLSGHEEISNIIRSL